MSINPFNQIQDPIARAEAMRAQAVADMIIDAADGVHRAVKFVAAKVSGYLEYRRTFSVLAGMTDRELDDIGITRGDIPAVARGIDPRAAERRPGDALARRLALAEAFEQEKAEGKVLELRANDNRPAAA
ncbi:MAG TPA: DUF1127 domain-containing protein, partial [Kiloniellaceae bacterium]|nr:DUF1127 domain-containing protein [Kiloniellaceae bacterium]